MIERLKTFIKSAKYMTMTLTDLGDNVQITVSIRPKDGADCKHPIQVQADYQIADTVLLTALTDPPKPGKEKTVPVADVNDNETDLFSGGE